MNIVKFKDTVAPSDLKDAELFNEHLRGKYAYWLHCRYVVPLSFIQETQAITYEVNINDLLENPIYEGKYIDTFEPIGAFDTHWICGPQYWDHQTTDDINDVSKYVKLNSYVPDPDVNMDNLKNFRGWLATQLLSVKSWDENTEHILNYYANGMTDDVAMWLTYFGDQKTITSTITINGCGCGTNSNVSSLYNESLLLCDSLSIYRNNIEQGMITLFSDIETWKKSNIGENLLNDIIKYLNNIIIANFPLVTTKNTLDIYSCKCLGNTNYAQEQAQKIIKDLIDAFQNILDDDPTSSDPAEHTIQQNKNKILTTLNDWAANLYEIMSWV